MNNLILSLFVPFLASASVIFILFGWGLLLGRYLKKLKGEFYFTTYVLFGLVGLTFLTKLFHILFPINWIFSLLTMIIGVLGMLISKNLLYVKLSHLNRWISEKKILSIGYFLILIYWCLRVTKISTNYDTAAYHLQVIRWINEYPSIPGIANLWSHLALNQSYFEFLALLRCFPFFNKGYALGAFIFFIITSLVLIERHSSRYINFVWIAFLFFLITHAPGSTMFSPTPDLIVGFIEIIIFCAVLEIINNKMKLLDNFENISLILLLSCYLFSLKLTGLIFASIISFVLLSYYFKSEFYSVKKLNRIILFCIAFTILHIFNGYILSGYPFFPSTLGGLDFLPWITPKHIGQELISVIHNGTIDPKGLLINVESAHFENWFPIWAKNLNPDLLSYIFFVITLLFINLFIWLKGSHTKIRTFYIFLLCLPTLSSLIFWLNSAPEFRYAGSVFEILIASLFFIFAYNKNILSYITKVDGLKYGFIIISICILPSLNKHLFVGWEATPKVSLNKHYIKSGIFVYIPDHELCWDSDLPCVYNLNPDIYLLDSKGFDSGFFIKK